MQYAYWTWKNCFSREECDHILDLCKGEKKERGTVANKAYDSSNIRNSTISWIRHNEIVKNLYQVGSEVNVEAFGFDLYSDPYINGVQFTEYSGEEKQHYSFHLDTIFNEEKYNFKERKLSLILQLSDPSEYEGGDLFLKIAEKNINLNNLKQKGTLIAFPSWILHKITPVTKGTRHSLVTWLNGPAWR